MNGSGVAEHRTIVLVDVEGFGDPMRTLPHQRAVRDGMYRVVREAFEAARVPWDRCHREDRGDSVFVLVPADIPKAPFVEVVPDALTRALHEHNLKTPPQQQIRLRMAVHAGEVAFDDHGVTATSVTTAFRLLDAQQLKTALAGSPGNLAMIVSEWIFDEVVRHSAVIDPATFRRIPVVVKETSLSAWVSVPDHPYPSDTAVLDRRADDAGLQASAPADPPPDESTAALDGPPPGAAFRRMARIALIVVGLVGAPILALSLPSLLNNNTASNHPANSNTATRPASANGLPSSATTDSRRDSTLTTEVTSPTVTKTPVQPGHLPDPCQAATAPTVREFGLGAGKPMSDTPATTKSCGWATTNNVNERSYRLIAIYYVTGEGALPSEFTPAPVSLPGVKAFQHADGLSCQLTWTTSFGAIVVMAGHNIYAPASTAPDMCTVAAAWSTAIFPNLPG